MIHTPAAFEETSEQRLFAFVEAHAFATLVTPDGADPCVTHLPLLLSRGEAGATLRGHMARGNPHWRKLPATEALAIFHGPHAYISPSWYGEHPSVPTWNYAVVHARGPVRLVEDAPWLDAMLGELVQSYESPRAQPWSMDLPSDYHTRMRAGIVGFEMTITDLKGKFKLSQNRSLSDQHRVVDALALGSAEDVALSRLMRSRLD